MNKKDGITWVFPFFVISVIFLFVLGTAIYKYHQNNEIGELKKELGYLCIGIDGLIDYNNQAVNCSAVKQGNFTLSKAFFKNTSST